MNETENKLVYLAEQSSSNRVAKKAMAELKKRFDSTYFWCNDCDGLVVKEKDCCLNRELIEKLNEELNE